MKPLGDVFHARFLFSPRFKAKTPLNVSPLQERVWGCSHMLSHLQTLTDNKFIAAEIYPTCLSTLLKIRREHTAYPLTLKLDILIQNTLISFHFLNRHSKNKKEKKYNSINRDTQNVFCQWNCLHKGARLFGAYIRCKKILEVVRLNFISLRKFLCCHDWPRLVNSNIIIMWFWRFVFKLQHWS